jgi:hypothetical protein
MRKTLLTTLVTAGLTAATLPAHAADLYGTQYSATTPLFLMNQGSGSATAGASTGTAAITDLASTGASTVIWGVAPSTNTLYRYDATTSAVTSTVSVTGALSPAGAAQPIVSLAQNGGTLYGNSTVSFGGSNELFRINPTTGAATWIGNTQIDKLYALAYNPADGFLYGASGEIGETSFLWKISTTTAAGTVVGTLSTTGNFDLAFRPGDNMLFLASSNSFSLYTVNVLTAAETLVGPYGSSTNIAGLAFAVPEPQTWALLAGGLACVGFTASRRRPR